MLFRVKNYNSYEAAKAETKQQIAPLTDYYQREKYMRKSTKKKDESTEDKKSNANNKDNKPKHQVIKTITDESKSNSTKKDKDNTKLSIDHMAIAFREANIQPPILKNTWYLTFKRVVQVI